MFLPLSFRKHTPERTRAGAGYNVKYHVPVACFMKVKRGDQVTKKGDQPTHRIINSFQSNGSSKPLKCSIHINVYLIKNRSKLSSAFLLCLLRILLRQTLSKAQK